MPEPDLTLTRLAGDETYPQLLIVGPSLGTSVRTLWGAAAALLAGAPAAVEVVGWDLPGHGASAPTRSVYTVAEVADVVRRRAAELAAGRPTTYAGVSWGGAVALELAISPGPFRATACLASAARIGEPAAWRERADLVRGAGTASMVAGSAQRWFAPGFLERDPGTGDLLLRQLCEVDDESYALACEALAVHDVTDRLAGVRVPVLVAPGELDGVIAPDVGAATAALMASATLHVIPDVAHLPPAEDPAAVTDLLRDALITDQTPPDQPEETR